MDAAVPMDAKNAPTGTWKTAGARGFPQASTRIVVNPERRSEKRLTHKNPDTPLAADPAPSPIKNPQSISDRQSRIGNQSAIHNLNQQSAIRRSALRNHQSAIGLPPRPIRILAPFILVLGGITDTRRLTACLQNEDDAPLRPAADMRADVVCLTHAPFIRARGRLLPAERLACRRVR